MKGDAARSARAILVRLALGLAAVSCLGLGIYVSGNAGSLSDEALSIALRFAGVAGLATVAAALSALVFGLYARLAGARPSPRTVLFASLSGAVGLAVLLCATLISSLTGGLSF